MAAAGGKDKAVVETFTATADGNGQITVNFSQGAADWPKVSGIEVLSGGTVVQAINCGEMAGGTITISPSSFTNQGTLHATGGGNLFINSSVSINDPGFLANSTGTTLSVSGNLTGDTRDLSLYRPSGILLFSGSGTSTSPQILEAMSQDLGSGSSGFVNNFVYSSIALSGGTYVKIVDQSDNAPGSGPEAVYVNSLVVPAGATLNLGGCALYARQAQIDGTIVGGAVNHTPNAGPLSLDSPTPGSLSQPGGVDAWKFFDRAGQSVTILLDPGSGSAGGPISPTLQWSQVQLLDPAGNVVATADSEE